MGAGGRALTTCLSWIFIAASVTAAHSEQPFVALVIDGAQVRWTDRATGDHLELRYAIAHRDTKIADAVNCGALSAPARLIERSAIDQISFQRAAREAFSRWERVANITFVEVHDQSDADIVIGEQAEPTGRAYTNLTLSRESVAGFRQINAAAICLNPESRWKIGFDGDLTTYDISRTLTHEIGHALGLDHPGARGHVMSFRYGEAEKDLTEGDVQGARHIYGPKELTSLTSRAGDHRRKNASEALPFRQSGSF